MRNSILQIWPLNRPVFLLDQAATRHFYAKCLWFHLILCRSLIWSRLRLDFDTAVDVLLVQHMAYLSSSQSRGLAKGTVRRTRLVLSQSTRTPLAKGIRYHRLRYHKAHRVWRVHEKQPESIHTQCQNTTEFSTVLKPGAGRWNSTPGKFYQTSETVPTSIGVKLRG